MCYRNKRYSNFKYFDWREYNQGFLSILLQFSQEKTLHTVNQIRKNDDIGQIIVHPFQYQNNL